QQQLVEQYVPMANKLAHKKKRTLPRFVDVEELKSAAYMGLVEAASRYKPEMGVAFSTFAYPRVSGAIYDYLRQESGGKREASVLSMDEPVEEECSLKNLLEARPERNNDEFLEAVSLDLGPQAREVLRHYFIDAYSMKEVGDKFGVSESRISQLIKQYKSRIRDKWTRDEFSAMLAA
ncbi:MAG: sigma-70 family RNA polymerase sigma factor, partial [Candidatus Thorarchaeota archaeon]